MNKLKNFFAIIFFGCWLLALAGCQTTPQQAAYQSAGTTAVTVQAALQAYDVLAAQGLTTPEQNATVRAAYLKYQAAFAIVCDAGAVYAASHGTNGFRAADALQTAIVNANQSINDLVALVKTYGGKP